MTTENETQAPQGGSTYNPEQWPQPYQQQPPQHVRDVKRPTPKWILPAGVAVLGLLLGSVGGSAIASTVDRTPAACVEALNQADEGFSIAGDALSAASDGISAASRFDVSGLEDASDGMGEHASKIKELAPKYNDNKDRCLATKK